MAAGHARTPVLPVPNGDGFFVAITLFALLAGCADRSVRSPARTAVEVIDDDGRSVRLDSAARRIISLIPARTDLILALGAADRLLARTQFDNDPRLADLPVISEALAPSVEWLAQQSPDLVIAWPDRQSRSVVTRLEDLGIPVYTSRVETLAELHESVRDLGVLLNLPARADSITTVLDSSITATRAAVADRARHSVIYLVGLDPPTAAGQGTFVHELIEIAGGRNVMADVGALWPPVSVEEVLSRQPEVVIVSTTSRTRDNVLADLRERPGWRGLEAVRSGRVHVVDANLFNRPGPSLVFAVGALAEAIHPELKR